MTGILRGASFPGEPDGVPKKIEYQERDLVEWHVPHHHGRGLIRGRAPTPGIIDFWIVELVDGHVPEYPYTCVVLPHSCIGLLRRNGE